MSSVYMGLGFYDIPNRFSDEPFDFCIEVDRLVQEQFESSIVTLCWDGTKLIELVIPTESEPI